jgi:flagellar hook assembly protein FlgD
MVRTLVAGRFVTDVASVAWDGKTEGGHDAPSGVYYARVMTSAGDIATGKIVRVR